jgi:hypothetical protein
VAEVVGAVLAADVAARLGDLAAFPAAPAAAGVAAFFAAAFRGVAFLAAACFLAGVFAVRAAFFGAPDPGVSSGAVTRAS